MEPVTLAFVFIGVMTVTNYLRRFVEWLER